MINQLFQCKGEQKPPKFFSTFCIIKEHQLEELIFAFGIDQNRPKQDQTFFQVKLYSEE